MYLKVAVMDNIQLFYIASDVIDMKFIRYD